MAHQWINAAKVCLTSAALACLTVPALAQDAPQQDQAEQRGGELTRENAPQGLRRVSGPSILVILAHPDDEVTIAPILARAARDGADISLVFATSGDAGPGTSSLEPGEELARLREGEALCAASALGLEDPIFWDLGDGTLADQPRDPNSASRQALAKITAIVAQKRPQVIMTWGPDGGYGHGDHRMISAAVTQVVQGMEGRRPDLLYSAIPAGSRPDLPEFEAWATTAPSLVTDRLSYQPQDVEAAASAIDCYKSQFSEEARAALAPLLHRTIWRGSVHFRLAFPAQR